MNAREAVTLLRTLGVPEELLTLPPHTHNGEGCGETDGCPSRWEALRSSNGHWGVLVELAERCGAARAGVRGDVLDLRRRVREAERRLTYPVVGHAVLPTTQRAHEQVQEETRRALTALQDELRTTRRRREVVKAAGVQDDGTRALLTLEEYRGDGVDGVVDAVVLTHTVHETREGRALVVPDALGRHVWERWEGWWGRVDLVELAPGEAEVVAETACRLWDPVGGGELALPEAALEAARRVCG